MLLDHARRAHELRSGGGREALATITHARQVSRTVFGWNEDRSAKNSYNMMRLALLIEPPGEPAFEAKLTVNLLFPNLPNAGGKLCVLYDPEDHSKVAYDRERDLVRSSRYWEQFRAADRAHKRAGRSLIAELKALADLHAGGALSEEEFQAQKAKLLDAS